MALNVYGQAYGIVSTILSVIALAALAASIAYQVRQRRDDRIVSWRAAQEGLLRMVLEDPLTFAPCISDIDRFKDVEQIKQYYFTTLWLAFARAGIQLGYTNEKLLRSELLDGMFLSPIAQELWVIRREALLTRLGYLDDFFLVVDHHYQKAIVKHDNNSGEPVVASDSSKGVQN